MYTTMGTIILCWAIAIGGLLLLRRKRRGADSENFTHEIDGEPTMTMTMEEQNYLEGLVLTKEQEREEELAFTAPLPVVGLLDREVREFTETMEHEHQQYLAAKENQFHLQRAEWFLKMQQSMHP